MNRTVETGIFYLYLSRLRGNGEGWGVEGVSGVREEESRRK